MLQPKLMLRIALFLLVVAGGILALGGITLTVKNSTGAALHEVYIDYGVGKFSVGDLRSGEQQSRRLGKIGEGARFTLVFEEGAQTARSINEIYFAGHSVFGNVEFEVLPHFRVLNTWSATSIRASSTVVCASPPTRAAMRSTDLRP
jgi:hypothetical protein